MHTAYNVVTAAVFHAPMFVLNAGASRNTCEPSHTWFTPIKSARTFRRGHKCARAFMRRNTHTHALALALANANAHPPAHMCAYVVFERVGDTHATINE